MNNTPPTALPTAIGTIELDDGIDDNESVVAETFVILVLVDVEVVISCAVVVARDKDD